MIKLLTYIIICPFLKVQEFSISLDATLECNRWNSSAAFAVAA